LNLQNDSQDFLSLTYLKGGRLSDIFGRRYFFLSGSALLIVGSIVSATGHSINQMIAGGAIFGAGSGFLEMSFGAVQVCFDT
jgi:MFS family permease